MIESYIDSATLSMLERQQKVQKAISVLQRVVHNHAFVEDDEPYYVSLDVVKWDTDAADIEADLSLNNENGTNLTYADVKSKDMPEYSVVSADLNFVVDGADREPMITVTTRPPNVLGYDGAPLPNNQLDGAIADLERYESLLVQDQGL